MIIKNIKGRFDGGKVDVGGISFFGIRITTNTNVSNLTIKETTLIVDSYEEIITPKPLNKYSN